MSHAERIEFPPMLPDAASYTIKQLQDHYNALLKYYTDDGISEEDMQDYAELDEFYDKQVAEIVRYDEDEGDGAVHVVTMFGVRVHFMISDIKHFVSNPHLTDDEIKEIAVDLVTNLETSDDPVDDECFPIERKYFNDSFSDMETDMIGSYSVRSTAMRLKAQALTEIAEAAYGWWSMHRPLSMNRQQHIESYSVNVQNASDDALAKLVAKWASDNPDRADQLDLVK
jgi:hypothetical protein